MLETAEALNRVVTSGGANRGTKSVDGSGFDGMALPKIGHEKELWLSTESSLRNSRDYHDGIHDSLGSFKASLDTSKNDLDPGSESWDPRVSGDGGLFGKKGLDPPKVTDSAAFGRTQMHQPPALGWSKPAFSLSGSYSRERLSGSFSSFKEPRSSPSKVGSFMWGSHTPLPSKGRAPFVGDDCWCCSVCLYTENPSNAKVCVICASPNYAVLKV
jgi:hypothetical protein